MQVVLGVVFNPVLEELFVAERGKGATLNGRGIAVSKTTSLQSALFATEIGVSRDPATVNAVFSRVRALCEKVSICFSSLPFTKSLPCAYTFLEVQELVFQIKL